MVWTEIKKNPKGKIFINKELAIRIGKPRAYRVVANAYAKNLLLEIFTYQGVIIGDGKNGWIYGKKE